jgi:hypothetical protein
LGKNPNQCQEIGGGDGAANRTTGSEVKGSPDSSGTVTRKNQFFIKKFLITPIE